jgi:hypothetical protein
MKLRHATPITQKKGRNTVVGLSRLISTQNDFTSGLSVNHAKARSDLDVNPALSTDGRRDRADKHLRLAHHFLTAAMIRATEKLPLLF